MTAPPPAADPTIDAFTDALWLEDGLSKNTLEAYRRDLRLYAEWLAAEHGATLPQTREQHLNGYMAARARGKATSANRRLTVFERYFRWALRERRIVPASGRMVTVSSRRRTRISGLDPTMVKSP